jgi:Outer membrane protein beta-barrel family
VLIAAYNRRVDRPTEADLRIFPKYDDPELLKVGNPFLRPQFTHALELGFARSWMSGSATASLYHRDITDAYSRIYAIDASNPNYYAKRNVPQGRQRSRSSLDVAAKWPVLNKRAELLFTFTDIFNDFAIQQEIDGQGFRAYTKTSSRRRSRPWGCASGSDTRDEPEPQFGYDAVPPTGEDRGTCAACLWAGRDPRRN